MAYTAMRERTFNTIRSVVYDTSGISLGPHKEALVCARVSKRMRVLGIAEYEQYVDYLESNPDELVGLLDAISTNVTSFFREPHHFEHIAEVAAQWYESGQRRFRFWSAACSTGEEPYSLAMVLREALPAPDVDMRILATDISTEALSYCFADYDERRMAPVPADLRQRWFHSDGRGADRRWWPNDRLRDTVVFRHMNLSVTPFALRGPLDAVFCRNVMIYFDNEVRTRLLEEITRLLKPGGFLVVGHAESLTGMIADLQYVKPSIYRKR